ncbi:synaptonemal complex central element protein 2 isoform X2 [Stigmatopora argus]
MSPYISQESTLRSKAKPIGNCSLEVNITFYGTSMDFLVEGANTSHSSQHEGHHQDLRMFQVNDTETNSSRNDMEENSSLNDISRRVQELVEKIHNRRKNNLKEIESFQQVLVDKVTEVCQQMKQDLYKAYEENSSEMEVKLLELTDVLEMCTKLHMKLLEASHVLGGLRDGLAISGAAEPVTD